jgi:hypothetical protein
MCGDVVVEGTPPLQYLMFTFHKAGSMGHHRYLRWLAEITGLSHHSVNYAEDDPDRRRFRLNFTPVQDDAAWWQDTGRNLDGIIGPIRRAVALPDDAGARVVIAVRDPRDALTSRFFSFAISHTGVDDELRQAWLDMGIDRFVLEHLPELKGRLATYRSMLATRPDTPVLRYEDMVLRFDHWLDRLLQGFGLSPDPGAVGSFARTQMEDYRKLIAERQVREREDKHIRSVAPGDHRRKLRPETIAAIDEALRDEMAFFGYEASRTDAD